MLLLGQSNASSEGDEYWMTIFRFDEKGAWLQDYCSMPLFIDILNELFIAWATGKYFENLSVEAA